jgi:hypothetical protein
MRYRRLGRTALRVSELCLGTMNFGPQTPEDVSHTIMDRALDLGINFFDTANRYGGDKGAGITEEIVGRWFALGGGRREKVVLATKLYGPMSDWPNDGRLSARHIRLACDDSLRRMQTDYIDVYQMHHIDRTAPWDEVWQAMDTLVQQGKIVYVGSSNFAGWHIAQANERATARGSLQPAHPHDRARSAPGVSQLWRRDDPVEPARRRNARWSAQQRVDRASPVADDREADRQAAPAARAVGIVVLGLGRRSRCGRPRLATAPGGRDVSDHRAADLGTARRRVASGPGLDAR